MSKTLKKAVRKKTSGGTKSPSRSCPILGQLAELSDNICNLTGHDSSLLASQTSRILAIATNDSTERKALMHKSSSGLSIILKALKVAENSNIVSDIISLFHLLADHSYTTQLVRRSVVSAVLVSLSDSHKSSWNTDGLLMQHLALLNKLAACDKRFAVKARLSGNLIIVVGLLKKHQEDQEKLIIVLKLLQALASSGVNADSLGKLGCLSLLVKILNKYSQKDYIVLKHCVGVLTPLLKQKTNAGRSAAQTCVKQLVLLHEQLHHTDINCRHILLRKKVLNCLKTCITKDANLQVFHKCSGLQVLYATAVQSSEGSRKASRSIASLTCSVLRKCLPQVPLPVISLKNPISFTLPRVKESRESENLLSPSSSARTTTSDLSAQLACTDKEERPGGSDDEEGEEGSVSSYLISGPSKKNSVNKKSSSDSDTDAVPSSRTCHPENSPDGSSHDMSNLERDRRLASYAENLDVKVDVDIETFKKYFPELEVPQESVSKYYPTKPTAETDKEVTKYPVVVVPTAVHVNEEDGEKSEYSVAALFKTAAYFTEESAPQILEHASPMKPELMYSKAPSVDRKLYLSDIARIANPKTLINKEVYNLDLLTEAINLLQKLQFEPKGEEMENDNSQQPASESANPSSSCFNQGDLTQAPEIDPSGHGEESPLESATQSIVQETQSIPESVVQETQSIPESLVLGKPESVVQGTESISESTAPGTESIYESTAQGAESIPNSIAQGGESTPEPVAQGLESIAEGIVESVPESLPQGIEAEGTKSIPKSGSAKLHAPPTDPVPQPANMENGDKIEQDHETGTDGTQMSPTHQSDTLTNLAANNHLGDGQTSCAPKSKDCVEATDDGQGSPQESEKLKSAGASGAVDSSLPLEYGDLEQLGTSKQNISETSLLEYEDLKLQISGTLKIRECLGPQVSAFTAQEFSDQDTYTSFADIRQRQVDVNQSASLKALSEILEGPEQEQQSQIEAALDNLEWEAESPFSSTVANTCTNGAQDEPPSPGSSPHLEFESRFESGNLRKAIQVREYEYDLLLCSDINTLHHHQWFYFMVSNNKPGVTYRFNIINCEKPNSQFNYGMQPLMFSTTAHRINQQGWVRTGTKVAYYSNNYSVPSSDGRKRKTYYTMTFSIVFQHDKDTCYFAYHYPYTYSMLLSDLDQIEAEVKGKDLFYHQQSLCATLCGNICPLITITNSKYTFPDNTLLDDTEAAKESRKYVVISCRVHPGESNSSWVMRGLLRHLTSNHPNAQVLRNKFVFKIIPMLNPDGVIHGSHRCSLSGEDLNRQWISPDRHLYPTIYSTKSLLQWLVATSRKPEVFCDFHGHSRRKNIFMYGCKSLLSSEQVLPRHLDKIAPLFSYGFCSFVVDKSKEATARVVVWRELGIAKSYTMESTYCGADQGPHKGRQINTADLEEMGTLFCVGLQRLDEQSDIADMEDGKRDSLEYMSCPSDSSGKRTSDDEDSASSLSTNEFI